jgi:flavin reductase (DIM6/NTAB) family NADH-FMN oxidoreductase RutF
MALVFNSNDIAMMDQRYRATFINSLGGFKSVCMIGTRSRAGVSNLAVFNSFVHLGANPPLFGLVFRPDTVERHTLDNILETRVFTVNHLTEENYVPAHQSSAKYPKGVSEFAETGLTEELQPGMFPPFVLESKVKIAATFVQKIDIEINKTILVLAKIKQVMLPDDVLRTDGFIDLQAAGTVTCSGLDAYYTAHLLERLSYARPGFMPQPHVVS